MISSTDATLSGDAPEDCSKSQYHHGNLRVALIGAALAILEEEGVGGLGLRSVARRAGVSQTAPYHHFGSKDGMLAAVAAEGFRRLGAEQQRVSEGVDPSPDPPDLEIRALGASYVRFARANPELYRLMFGSLIQDRDSFPELVDAYTVGYRFIEEATSRYLDRLGATDYPVKIAVSAAWVMVHGLSYLLNDGKIRPGEDGLPDEDELVETILGVLSAGVPGQVGERAARRSE